MDKVNPVLIRTGDKWNSVKCRGKQNISKKVIKVRRET